MNDQLSAISLSVDELKAALAQIKTTLGDLGLAFDGFNAGQARIIEAIGANNRLLSTLIESVSEESDSENLGDLLRATLSRLDQIVAAFTTLPHDVASEVVLHTDGLVLPPQC